MSLVSLSSQASGAQKEGVPAVPLLSPKKEVPAEPSEAEMASWSDAQPRFETEEKDGLPQLPSEKASLENVPPVSEKDKSGAKKSKKRKHLAQLEVEPSYVQQMRVVAEQADIPTYGTQGEDAGKSRGRPKAKAQASKPRNASSSARIGSKARKDGQDRQGSRKAKAKARPSQKETCEKGGKATKQPSPKKRASKISRRRRVLKAGSPTKQEQDVQAQVSGHSRQKAPRGKKASKQSKPEACPSAVEEPKPCPEEPQHSGLRRTPPSHVTWNHVYSSAYRKNIRWGVEFAKKCGQKAGQMFRTTGQVDDLCGQFRSHPRVDSKATDVEAEFCDGFD